MKIRRPAVAGQFYPGDPQKLRKQVQGFLRDAGPGTETPRAIIAPHAGYIYSGPVAASAYVHVACTADRIRRVVLLGPPHRAPVRALAASSVDAFATPLGDVPLDVSSIQELVALPQVAFNDEAHAPEHGLEVHLPFLQLTLSTFALIPLLVGAARAADVAHALTSLIQDDATLIVVSSDLSHYQPYDVAQRLDRQTSQQIEALRDLRVGQACGQRAINGLLHLARQRGWRAKTVDLRNSGDTAGPRDQVVGYGAYILV